MLNSDVPVKAVFKNGQVLRKYPDLPRSNLCCECNRPAGTIKADGLDADSTVIVFKLTLDGYPYSARYLHKTCNIQ